MPASPQLGGMRLAVLLASLLAGIGAALAAMPTIFRATPTDISRIGVVLEALHARDAGLQVAVLGNSAIMSGIDAGALRDALPGTPLAWNLATTGQTLVESAMLAEEIPPSVEVVVLATPLRAGAEYPLHPQKNNTYYMFGLRPSPALVELLGELYGDEVRSLLVRSRLAQIFESRWVVRQLVDTQLRMLLRRDLQLANAETDLLHPQRYTLPVAPDALVRSLALYESGLEGAEPRVPESDTSLLLQLAAWNAAAGRRTVVLIPPVHPSLRESRSDAFAKGAARLAVALESAPDTRVVDASALLSSAEFIDAVHPTDAGALRLTQLVADGISRAR